MVTTISPLSNTTAGIVDLETIRINLKNLTGKQTPSWLQLSDSELRQQFNEVSQTKRFIERYCGDPSFRQAFLQYPELAIQQYNLQVEPKAFKALVEIDFAEASNVNSLVPESLQNFWNFLGELGNWKELNEIAASSSNPHFKAWRLRQIARSRFQLHESNVEVLVNTPLGFELTKGCSVGCYFCAVSAPQLGDIFPYTEANAKLWREVLELMRETLGSAVSAGSSYWATDPLDNPDYEKFMIDFHEILGVFPQTTTAQPIKDPARLRSLLKLSFEKGCKLNRISVLSIKILDQIHKEFSAEELAFVGLIPQNPGGRLLTQFPFNTQPVKKVNAGRTFERSQKKTDSSNSDVMGGTIACLTGFLFNMVDRSVKLISPCSADERWPLGYIIFDQGTFSDINDLRKLIARMIAKNMPLTLREQDLLKFRPELEYQSLANGFKLSTQWQTLCFRNRRNYPHLPSLKN